MNISVTVNTVELDRLTRELRPEAGKLVRKTVFDGEARVKENIVAVGAVDTGAMLNGVNGTMETDLRGTVSVPAEYAPHVNYGTVYVAARPFWEPGLDFMQRQLDTGARAMLRG